MNLSHIDNYIGNIRQLNDVKFVKFIEGKASELKAYEVTTASGLHLTIELDRGMDISDLKVDGINIGFLSSTGLVNSTYFVEDKDKGFMRNFNVGFLTTGGLSYMGSSDKSHGLHGRISNTPAENYSYLIKNNKIIITGNIFESQMFGPNLRLHREITIGTNTKTLKVKDTLTNLNDIESPYMILYHNNYGFPFFNENTKLKINSDFCVTRFHEEGKDYANFHSPDVNKNEVVYFHHVKDNQYKIISPKTNLRVKVKYNGKNLPVLNEWKLERLKNYVLGLEPATNNVNGYNEAKQENNLHYIKPNQSINFELDYKFEKIG